MKTYQNLVRCIAYKNGNLYTAVCLDLFMAAHGNTINEAIAKLKQELKEFISIPFAIQLIKPTPFSMWSKYYWIKFLLTKNGNRRDVMIFEAGCSPSFFFREGSSS